MAGANKLIVGNLPFDITEEDLHTVFSTYGEVTEVQILSEDKATGLRYAYICYRETKAGEDAITVLNEAYKIRTDAQQPITVAWDKQDGGSGPGSSPQQYQGTQGGNGDWSSQDSSGGYGSGAGGSSNSGDWGGNSGANTKPPEDAFKLFVGGLPEDITEEELRTVFGTYGEVVHVHIMKANSVTGLRGAFIYYSKKQAAEDAIKVLDQEYKIREGAESPIQVRWSKDSGNQGRSTEESHRLFVGSLPPDIREDELKTVFSAYGEINTVHLMAPHAKTNMRAALVFYVKREAGEDAIKFLNENYRFREDGDPIQVKWGKEKEWSNDKGKGGKWGGGWGSSWGGDAGWSAGGKGGGGWQALGNAGGGWSDRSAGGWSAQESWGSSAWQDNSWSDNSGGWGGGGKGWGSSDGGWGTGCKGCDKGGGGYDMGGYDMGGGYDTGKGKGCDYGAWGKGKGIEEPSTKLYVANLPEDIQDNALEYVFGTYGKVQKVHIMNQRSRGGAIAAFVEFATTEEAETAIASLHEKYEIRPGYGMIQVKHAYRRPKPY